jgi:hypothetical protein
MMIYEHCSDYILVDRVLQPDDFVIKIVHPSRQLLPEVEHMIEENWANTLASPLGNRFFDGGLWRYVSHRVHKNRIELVVEPTSFKIYKGTNIDRLELFQQYGESVMANPLIVNGMVRTIDGNSLFARRSDKVALFQHQIHIIGGTVPRKMDTLLGEDFFQTMREELFEEVAICPDEIDTLKCVGLRLNMPYRNRAVAFTVDVNVTAAELQARVAIDAYEHEELIFVSTDTAALTRFVQQHEKEIALPARCWIAWELSKY